jgi:hypothetical protein
VRCCALWRRVYAAAIGLVSVDDDDDATADELQRPSLWLEPYGVERRFSKPLVGRFT